MLHLTGVLVGVLVLLSGLAGATPATAESVDGGWSRAAGVAGTGYFVGQHRTADGKIAYCTDIERLSPDRASGYAEGGTGPFTRSDGTALSAGENAALAFILGRWGATTDDADAAAVQLAVWSLTAVGMHWDGPGMTSFLSAQRLAPDLEVRARAMLEQARTEAGPYSIRTSFEPDGTGGRVAASVVSADGTPRPGLQVSAVVEEGMFGDTSTTARWTSTDGPHDLVVRRTGFGHAGVTIVAPTVPAPNATWLLPVERDVQRLVVAPVSAEASASVEVPAPTRFAPRVTTATSSTRTAPGAEVFDVLEVTSDAPWTTDPVTGRPVTLEVVSTLWGPLSAPPVEGASVPAGSPSLGSTATRVEGPGRYETPALTVPAPGYYVWTETIDPTSALPAGAAPFVDAWTGRFGLAAETTLVPWSPGVTTRLSRTEVLAGGTVQDTTVMSNFAPTDDADVVQLTMYGPLAESPVESADVPAGTPVHSVLEVPARNGSVTSGDFAPLVEPGCYTVVAGFVGSGEESGFTSAFGIPAETVCVQPPVAPVPPVSGVEPAPVPDASPVPAAGPPPALPAAPPAAPPAELARTGVSAAVVSGLALISVGAGLGLRTLARRRA